MRKEDWHSRPRLERLANVMYPGLADDATRKEMLSLAANEGKQSGLERRMNQADKAYGRTAQPKADPYRRGPSLMSRR